MTPTGFGKSVRRVEDDELLTGSARFTGDFDPDGTLHVAFVRSALAAADILGIDTSAAASVPGVHRVVVHDDVSDLRWDQLDPGPPQRSALAIDRVRYQGEPIAAVVADDTFAAAEGAVAVVVDYEPRSAIVTVEEALAAKAPPVYDEVPDNIGFRRSSEAITDLFTDARVVIEETFSMERMAPGMLEPRAVLAIPSGSGVTVYCSHQMPHRLRDQLAEALGLDTADVRVVAPEVGGGFGAKSTFYQEYPLVARLAMDMQRPIRYVESRSENLLVTSHGRAQQSRIALGATAGGEITGMRAHVVGALGAAVEAQRWCLQLTGLMLSGCYAIPKIEYDIVGVFTNTAPVGAFRGAGRPEAAYAIERAIDMLARELGRDPVDLRRQNFIAPEAFPYSTGLGSVYDSGHYAAALDVAAERVGYSGLRAEQQARLADGHRALLGIGVASYAELSGGGEEFGDVTVHPDGDVVVRTGTSPHGQGHRTTWAQIVAEKLGVPIESIAVVHGDTASVPRGGGTAGSRSAPLGGAAVGRAADSVAASLRALAADRLEAAAEDIVLEQGRATVVGTGIGVPIVDLVAELDAPLHEANVFQAEGLTYPFGSHACAVEIDRETGEIRVLAYVAVDDCGTVINPMITEGQVHGGVLQGVSHILREAIRFDEHGGALTGNWVSYQIPSIGQRVAIDAVRTETPTPNNDLGVKGIGEAGTTGSGPAVANAVMDALAPLGVSESDLAMPYTPDRVWRALHQVGAAR